MGDFVSALRRVLSKRPLLCQLIARVRMYVLLPPAFFYRLCFFPRVYLPWSVKLIGARRISLGANVVIGARSWLNVNDRFGSAAGLIVGDNVFVGVDNFFSVGKRIVVGDYSLTAKGCSFVGSSHYFDDPNIPYLVSGTKSEDEIIVGVNCFFGAGSRVIGNVVVGHGSVIGSGADVRSDVPPFSLVVGAPGRVIKRFDFGSNAWVRWPTDCYVEGPDEASYLRSLRDRIGAPVQHLSAASSTLGDLP